MKKGIKIGLCLILAVIMILSGLYLMEYKGITLKNDEDYQGLFDTFFRVDKKYIDIVYTYDYVNPNTENQFQLIVGEYENNYAVTIIKELQHDRYEQYLIPSHLQQGDTATQIHDKKENIAYYVLVNNHINQSDNTFYIQINPYSVMDNSLIYEYHIKAGQKVCVQVINDESGIEWINAFDYSGADIVSGVAIIYIE